jgi:hypothetical protein
MNVVNFGLIPKQRSRHHDQVRKRRKQTMIHHISIAVRNPLHVADVLAEILEGQVFPAPPDFPKNARVVFPGDEHGTLIEVLPYGTELRPGDSEAGMRAGVEPNSSFGAIHAYISVKISAEQLLRVGARERWLTRRCNRGPFELIEFWIENWLLIEFAPPEMSAQYVGLMTDPEALQAAMAELTANRR